MDARPDDMRESGGGEPLAAPSSPGTVFVVDDDASFRTAVARLLRASGFAVQTYATAAEFLGRPTRAGESGDGFAESARIGAGPACVLLDLQMPGLNGLELQETLARQEGHRLPVIFITGHGDIPAAVQAMRLGAEDFLDKCAPREQILAAVRRALARDARQRRREEQREALKARLATLSPREKEVLGHVLQGKLNKQIAADLGIHERTVKLHRTAITGKLGVPSVAELVQLCIKAGFAPELFLPSSASMRQDEGREVRASLSVD